MVVEVLLWIYSFMTPYAGIVPLMDAKPTPKRTNASLHPGLQRCRFSALAGPYQLVYLLVSIKKKKN
jgi:hypothetical protein